MVDSEVFSSREEGEDTKFNRDHGCTDCYTKLILLRRRILDYDQDSDKMRRLICSINSDIYATNEKIKMLVDSNQKRLDLIEECKNRLEYHEAIKMSCFEEYVSLIPLNDIKNNCINKSCD